MLVEIEAIELMNETEFTEQEKTIERGKKTFIEVGKALAEIRDRKGYRFHYKTFEEYCLNRWGWSVRTGYNMMAAAKTVENIQQIENVQPVAQIDYSKAVLLSGLTPEEQVAFVKEHDVFQMTKRELENELKARKAAERAAKEAEARAAEERKKAQDAEENIKDLVTEVQRLNKQLTKAGEPVIPEEIKQKLAQVDMVIRQLDKVSAENKLLKFQLEATSKNPEQERIALESKASVFTGRIQQFLHDMAALTYIGQEVISATSYTRQEYEKSLSQLEKWCREMRAALNQVNDRPEVIDAEVVG